MRSSKLSRIKSRGSSTAFERCSSAAIFSAPIAHVKDFAMGVASSTTIADLDSNAVLLKLVGEEKLVHEASLDDSSDKSYWDELLSFAFQPPDTR